MDFNAWAVDLAAGRVTHSSGFVLTVEGDPSDPSAVEPTNFPAELNFIEQTRLLRMGLEFLAKAAAKEANAFGSRIKTDVKTAAIKAREAEAKRYADNPAKPKRSLLSLKKAPVEQH